MQPTVPTETIVATLKALIDACQAVGFGFRDAAEGFFSPNLKVLFSDSSLRWIRCVGDLQIEMQRFDSDALIDTITTADSQTNRATQAFFDLDQALKTGNEIAILTACIYGEDIVIEMYRDALKQDFPPTLFHLIDEQLAEIEAWREQLRHIREPGIPAATKPRGQD